MIQIIEGVQYKITKKGNRGRVHVSDVDSGGVLLDVSAILAAACEKFDNLVAKAVAAEKGDIGEVWAPC